MIETNGWGELGKTVRNLADAAVDIAAVGAIAWAAQAGLTSGVMQTAVVGIVTIATGKRYAQYRMMNGA